MKGMKTIFPISINTLGAWNANVIDIYPPINLWTYWVCHNQPAVWESCQLIQTHHFKIRSFQKCSGDTLLNIYIISWTAIPTWMSWVVNKPKKLAHNKKWEFHRYNSKYSRDTWDTYIIIWTERNWNWRETASTQCNGISNPWVEVINNNFLEIILTTGFTCIKLIHYFYMTPNNKQLSY